MKLCLYTVNATRLDVTVVQYSGEPISRGTEKEPIAWQEDPHLAAQLYTCVIEKGQAKYQDDRQTFVALYSPTRCLPNNIVFRARYRVSLTAAPYWV